MWVKNTFMLVGIFLHLGVNISIILSGNDQVNFPSMDVNGNEKSMVKSVNFYIDIAFFQMPRIL